MATYIITGTSKGIGKALALEMAKRGHNLGLMARSLDQLEAVRADISEQISQRGAKPVQIEIAPLDVNKVETVPEAILTLFSKFERVDGFVANAGINRVTHIGQGQFDDQQAIFQTNVTGAVATLDVATAYFIKEGAGHLVATSSLASFQPVTRQAAYCASKAALSMYMDVASRELLPHGIDVTSILPGFIDTGIVEGVDIGKMPFATTTDKAAKEMADCIEKRKKKALIPAWPWKYLRPFLRFVKT